MRLSAVKILGINVTNSFKKEILEQIEKGLFPRQKKGPGNGKILPAIITIVTPNPEQIVLAVGDTAYRDILNRADVALPDGSGVVWAVGKAASGARGEKRQPITDVIPGVEFMENLVALAQKRGVRIALIGGYSDVAVKALECLKGKYPGLEGASMPVPGIHMQEGNLEIERQNNPDEYFEQVARTIVSDGAKMAFIALGAPKQEYYMEALTAKLKPIAKRPMLLMVVGGSFDILAGKTPRAPVSIRQLRIPFSDGAIGFEWAWRLVHQPWRLVRQAALVKFVFLVLKESFRRA